MTRLFYIGIISMTYLLFSCSHDRKLEQALEQAGDNRAELESVLTHYAESEDSRKLEAAKYLISNMPGHYSMSSKEYEAYCHTIDTMKPTQGLKECMKIAPLHESRKFFRSTQPMADAQNLTATYLINHIDWVFAQWDSLPWLAELRFEDLCEYLLPYRIAEEIPFNWENAGKRLCEKLDERRKMDDMKYSVDRLTENLTEDIPELSEINMTLPGIGNYQLDCLNEAYRDLIIYRALGIPAALDHVPAWANYHDRHYWAEPYDPALKTHSKYWAQKMRAPKIYRKTFSSQKPLRAKQGEYVPVFFRKTNYRDVTDEYMPTSSIEADFIQAAKTRYKYLAVFNDLEWKPVAISRTNRFEQMGRNTVYLPLSYANKRERILGYPIILDGNGDTHSLIPDTTRRQSLTLTRKYPYESPKRRYNTWGINTCIVASNDSLFRETDTLYTILHNVGMNYLHIKVNGGKAYRYLKIMPKQYAEIAELNFRDHADRPLRGNISAPMDKIGTAIGDGDALTYATVRWELIVDFGVPAALRWIDYLGRNDGNSVFPGESYELFYFDRDGWVSCGCQVATGESVTFDDVPSGALYWLRNRSKGKEERIFTVERGNVRFW